MDNKEINDYKEAGRIWKNIINTTKKIKEGTNLTEFAKKIESKIMEEAEIAFPINLSLNEEAAHYTPNGKDKDRILTEKDVLKIDLGVHVNGHICDGAITINLDNTHAKQIEANELALSNAISITKYGTTVEQIGKEIETTLKEKGFNPVFNLGGHGLGKYDIHAWPSIPNHANASSIKLDEGAIAIEPFSSTGEGYIHEDSSVEIFALNKGKNVRNIYGRKILEVAKTYKGLPFSERWLREKSKLNDFSFTIGLRELMKANCFESFPGLKETKNTIVTQVEKSVLVLKDKTIVLGE